MSEARTVRRASEEATPIAKPIEVSPSVVMLSDPDGPTAEAIRALRTRLQAGHLLAGHRAVAMCGPNAEVGCTFIALNLAVALSQIGIKTLLVDGDLREPTVQTYFRLPKTSGGLYECLMSGDDPKDFTHEDVLPNLSVLFAGHPGSAAQELLAGDRFAQLGNTCLRDYEMTIVDTPPANSCADSRRISTVLGFSLIVARKHRTLVSDVRTLADQLSKENAHVVGTVLNSF